MMKKCSSMACSGERGFLHNTVLWTLSSCVHSHWSIRHPVLTADSAPLSLCQAGVVQEVTAEEVFCGFLQHTKVSNPVVGPAGTDEIKNTAYRYLI